MQMHLLAYFIFSLHCLANSSGLHFQAQNKEYAHLKPAGFLYKIGCPIPPHGLLKPQVPHVLAINCKPHLPVFQQIPIILLVRYPIMPPWSPHRPAQVDITRLVSQAIACYLRPGWWIRNSWGFLSHHWGWLSRGPGDLYEIIYTVYIYIYVWFDTVIQLLWGKTRFSWLVQKTINRETRHGFAHQIMQEVPVDWLLKW
jgi:hypothetical protein